MRIINILTSITRNSLYALILLIPLFFLPFTSDFVEFNKQYLLYVLVGISFLSWFIKGFVQRNFTLIRTPLDVPLLALWVVVLAASIFSKDRTLSFFGSYERLAVGFIPITFYILFFYLIVNNIREGKYISRFFYLLGIGGGISAIYFWFKMFGVKIAGILPAWNVVATTNGRFGVILLIVMFVGFIFLLQEKLTRKSLVFWYIVSGISFITAIVLGYKVIFIAGAIGTAILLIFALSNLQGIRISTSSLLLVVFLIFLIFTIFGNFNFLTASSLPVEVSLAQGTSWKIAVDTLKEGIGRALIGSGPSTFVYDFSAHRPESFNGNIFWSLRFATPYSEGSGLLATIGILGAVIFLFLGFIILRFFKSVKANNKTSVANGILFRGITAITISVFLLLFFVPFGTVLWIYFFAMMAMVVLVGGILQGNKEQVVTVNFDGTAQSSLVVSFSSIIIVVVFVVLGIYLGRFYAGEVYFQKALSNGNPEQSDERIIKVAQAGTFNPQRIRYLLTLAQLQFQKALAESQKETPDAGMISSLIGSAVSNAKRATDLAPNSAEAWETLGGMYVNVIGIAEDARVWAIDSYSKAIDLEPTSPVFYVLRGNLYQGGEKLDEARKDYEKAAELKPDYALAHASLAGFHESMGDINAAVESQQTAVRFARGDLGTVYNLARLMFNRDQEGDIATSEAILKEILNNNADYANALFTLGSIYQKQGKVSEALAQFRHLQELNPNNEMIRSKINELNQ